MLVRSRVLLTVIVTVSGACSADLGPDTLEPLPQRRNYTASESELSIVGYDDGTRYTLNISAGEIRMSDGRVLVLDEEQTAEATVAFQNTIATDPVARDISTLTYAYDSCSNPDSKVGCEDQLRVLDPFEPLAAQPSQQLQRPSSKRNAPRILWRRSKNLEWETPRRHGPRSARNKRKVTSAGSAVGDFLFAQYSGTSATCNQIAQDVVVAAQEHFDNRIDFIEQVWAVAKAEAENALRKRLPPGAIAATMFRQLVAEHMNRSIRVNIIAVGWNSYGCGSRYVTAGPIYMGGGGGGGGGGGQCGTERWEISFNGGQSWSPIWVTVCYA